MFHRTVYLRQLYFQVLIVLPSRTLTYKTCQIWSQKVSRKSLFIDLQLIFQLIFSDTFLSHYYWCDINKHDLILDAYNIQHIYRVLCQKSTFSLGKSRKICYLSQKVPNLCVVYYVIEVNNDHSQSLIWKLNSLQALSWNLTGVRKTKLVNFL